MQDLGPYRLREELGRGGMGVVYRAEDGRDGRVVALKVLLDTSADLELLERFRREATLLHRIQHPNLVRVFELSMRPPRPYAAFEYVEGETLEARVGRDGALPWREAVQILTEVAAGLEAAHGKGLLHRDIKPENVLLAPGGAKLADFGMVRDASLESLTMTGALVGSPKYMAPELALGDKARWGPTTDVYGLSATLYFALTGKPPFDGASSIEIMTRVIEDPPPTPSERSPGGPAWLDALCQQGLAKDNAERPPSAFAFQAALGAGLESEPPPRARRLWPLGVGALLLVGVVGVGLAVWPTSDPSPSPIPADPPEADTAPTHADAVVTRALAFADRGLLEEGLAECNESLEAAPTAAVYGCRAELQLMAGRPNEALADYGRAMQLDLEDPRYAFLRGLLQGRLGRSGEALSDLDEALARAEGSFPEALAERAWIKTQLKDDEGAWTDAERALELDDGLGVAHAALAWLYSGAQRRDEADRASRLALELSPQRGACWAARGFSLAVSNRTEESIPAYTRAIELDDLTPRYRVLRGIGLAAQGREAEALKDAERALKLDPQLPEGLMLRGSILLARGQPDEGLRCYDRSLELAPTATNYVKRGQAYYNLRRLPEALADYERATELEPNNPWAWSLKGSSLLSLQRPRDALEALERAVELDPRLGRNFLFLAVSHDLLGDPRASLTNLERALELGLDETGTRAAEEHVRRLRAELGLEQDQ